MRIKRNGISRIVSHEEYEKIYQKQGYVIVDDPNVIEVEIKVNEILEIQEEKEMTKADIINELVARGLNITQDFAKMN